MCFCSKYAAFSGCLYVLCAICSVYRSGKTRSWKLQYFGHLMQRVDLLEKTLMLGGIEGQEEKGTTGDEMAGWHHQLDGHEFE